MSKPELKSKSTSHTLASSKTSVILVGHGDLGTRSSGTSHRPNQALLKHAEAIAALARFSTVTAGVLKGEPSLESAVQVALAHNPDGLIFYPFFMADGYFTGKVLPNRLSDMNLKLPMHTAQPLGLDPALPDLVLRQALECAAHHDVKPSDAHLVLAGHGSKFGPASANATKNIQNRISKMPGPSFATTTVAFLEEEPFLDAALKAHRGGQVIVSGIFNGDGLHAGEDVPQAVAQAGSNVIYAGPIGALSDVTKLIANALAIECTMIGNSI